MTFLSLAIPTYQAYKAVKQAGMDGATAALHSAPGTQEAECAQRLHRELRPFFQEQQIDHNQIKIFNTTEAQVQGINSLLTASSYLFINPEIETKAPLASNFLAKREIFLLKSSTAKFQNKIRIITTVAVAIITTFALSFIASVGLTFLTDRVLKIGMGQWNERKADNFAIKHSTKEELIDTLVYLKALKTKEDAVKSKKSWIRNFIFDLDLSKPSYASKISKIQTALSKDPTALPNTYLITSMNREQGIAYERKITELSTALFPAQ